MTPILAVALPLCCVFAADFQCHARSSRFSMQASHKNAQKQLQRTSQNLTDSISAIDAFEEELQSAGARYTFLQQIKAYIADLCDMLQVVTRPLEHSACLCASWAWTCALPEAKYPLCTL